MPGLISFLLVPLLVLPWLHHAAFAQSVLLTIDDVETNGLRINGIRLVLSDLEHGAAYIEIRRLAVASHEWRRLRLHCTALDLQPDLVECKRGMLSLPRSSATPSPINFPLSFAYRPSTHSIDIAADPMVGERWVLHSAPAQGGRRNVLELQAADLSRLGALFPLPTGWQFGGRADGRIVQSALTTEADFRLTNVRFANQAGTYAGEKLSGTVRVRARREGEAWNWNTAVDWSGGEVYAQPFYLVSEGVRADAIGSLANGVMHFAQAKLDAGKLGALTFEGDWDLASDRLARLHFETGRLDLAGLAPVLISPLIAQGAGPKLDWSGNVQIDADVADGALMRMEAQLDKVSVAEADARYAVRQISGRLPWHANQATQARIEVGGAQWGRLPIGPFVLPLQLQGRSFALSSLQADVLDGKLVLDDIHFVQRNDGPHWRGAFAVTPLSMEQLSAALGLPRMSGVFSASIPGIRQSGSSIELEGALVIQVFDGFAQVTDLSLIEPFGRSPRLFADVEIRGLDLEMLTRTFSFGSVTGRVDGDVKGLELSGWQPLRFDARVLSSPGSYRKRISQRAVQNIGALGGAGAAAAIQRSVLRVFDEFSYGKLGMSCVLRNGVCEMGGIADAPSGYVMVQGAGIPAINVIGYNRRVDWDELLQRLKRITDANAKPVIK